MFTQFINVLVIIIHKFFKNKSDVYNNNQYRTKLKFKAKLKIYMFKLHY